MKKLLVLILAVIFLFGCMPHQNYIMPTSKVKADFMVDREECAEQSGYSGGSFFFGPVILILPIVAIIYFVQRSQQKDFQSCMVNLGYTCKEGCYE